MNGLRTQYLQNQSEITIPFNSGNDSVWIEVEKNQLMKVCFDNETIKTVDSDMTIDSLQSSCIFTKIKSSVGVSQLVITDLYQKKLLVNFAVGMKILDLQSSIVKLGYNGSDYELVAGRTEDVENNRIYYDPERLTKMNALYLVDKYPITNCEFMNFMSDEVNLDVGVKDELKRNVNNMWNYRRKRAGEKKCVTNDSAANIVYL